MSKRQPEGKRKPPPWPELQALAMRLALIGEEHAQLEKEFALHGGLLVWHPTPKQHYSLIRLDPAYLPVPTVAVQFLAPLGFVHDWERGNLDPNANTWLSQPPTLHAVGSYAVGSYWHVQGNPVWLFQQAPEAPGRLQVGIEIHGSPVTRADFKREALRLLFEALPSSINRAQHLGLLEG